jgi:hypothetical protein
MPTDCVDAETYSRLRALATDAAFGIVIVKFAAAFDCAGAPGVGLEVATGIAGAGDDEPPPLQPLAMDASARRTSVERLCIGRFLIMRSATPSSSR